MEFLKPRKITNYIAYAEIFTASLISGKLVFLKSDYCHSLCSRLFVLMMQYTHSAYAYVY